MSALELIKEQINLISKSKLLLHTLISFVHFNPKTADCLILQLLWTGSQSLVTNKQLFGEPVLPNTVVFGICTFACSGCKQTSCRVPNTAIIWLYFPSLNGLRKVDRLLICDLAVIVIFNHITTADSISEAITDRTWVRPSPG